MTDYRQKSWQLQSLPQDLVPTPPVEGCNTADVIIIGGGYTGLSAGYYLKKFHPEMEVCLLESDICGYGASGRNGGFSMTLFGLTKGITELRFDAQKDRSAHFYMEQAPQIRRIEHDFEIMEKWGLSHHYCFHPIRPDPKPIPCICH